MLLKAFNTLLFCFITTLSFAQFTLTGKVLAEKTGASVNDCTVYLNDNRSTATTGADGKFRFTNLKNGSYVLIAVSNKFRQFKLDVLITDSDKDIEIRLSNEPLQLEEVVISEKVTDFGFTHMRAVDNMGIYEGKKSEVIIPEQLVANLSTNNARQIYAKVAGLNIWENEGSGLQLSVGGRGLDPNRSSNFNVRQNGYDISADALGYPESYYTPPTEAVGQIQIVRGAASLQYGTQFGGLINFQMKKPVADKKLELIARQSLGSYNFYNTFTSASGTVNKLSYYTFFQYKKGSAWRPNSDFNAYTAYADVNYQVARNTSLGLDVTHMNYLTQQPGGLTDQMYREDPRQSNRERNWFKVNWNLFAFHLDHKFDAANQFNLRVFGLSANRFSLGFRPNRVATIDDNSSRDLIKGDFENWGSEARYLRRYRVKKAPATLLVGGRYYHGFNHAVQGAGSSSKLADFEFVNPETTTLNDYEFPNRNVSLFAENIFNVSSKFSVTPGLRYEYINTKAAGFYASPTYDLAGNLISNIRTDEQRESSRGFAIAGLGLSYKPAYNLNIYSNISQNYRSITFSDIRIANPSSVVDPNLQDEKGYSLDLGIRTEQTSLYNFDVSLFYLNYNNRIGEVQFYDENDRILRNRTNIGQAIIRGIEAYGEVDLMNVFKEKAGELSSVVFANLAFIQSDYRKSRIAGVQGRQVEFVPAANIKSGIMLGYKNLKASYQLTYLSDQFSDATNAKEGGVSAVIGLIPAYTIMDGSMSYQFKRFKLEGSVNNLSNQIYFTRRATGYPGPGILPADTRSFYLTLQVKI